VCNGTSFGKKVTKNKGEKKEKSKKKKEKKKKKRKEKKTSKAALPRDTTLRENDLRLKVSTALKSSLH